jgi:hypothetical protein
MNHIKMPDSIKKAIEEFANPPPLYRFEVFQGVKDANGKITKSNSVGMAYLKSGEQRYSLRIFTFVDDKFCLLPDQHDPSLYRVLTSILIRSKDAKRKYIWNVVGNGKVNTKQGVIEIKFDLFDKPIYLNIFPERSAVGTKIPEPVFFEDAA